MGYAITYYLTNIGAKQTKSVFRLRFDCILLFFIIKCVHNIVLNHFNDCVLNQSNHVYNFYYIFVVIFWIL